MKNEIGDVNKTFDDIKHIDEAGNEYWKARELMVLLDYKKWKNFEKVIGRAMTTCKISNISVLNNFIKAVENRVVDYKLSRYACYLIFQNGDSSKKQVALAQNYMYYQTRKREKICEEEGISSEVAFNIFKNSLIHSLLEKNDVNKEKLNEISDKVDKVINKKFSGLI